VTFANIQLDDWVVEVELSAGVWTDITSYIISDIYADGGIKGNDPRDRVAGTGEMNFVLNNADLRFSPDYSGVLTGWKKGVKIRLVLTYSAEEIIRWKGKISSIKLIPALGGLRLVEVQALDWMGEASKTPLETTAVLADKRGDEVIAAVNLLMPISPENTSLAVGETTYPTVLDFKGNTTKAMTEFSKVALSEPGFIYLRKDRIYGETLIFEKWADRGGSVEPSSYSLVAADSGHILQEDGDDLLMEDGDFLLLDEVSTPTFDNNMFDFEIG